MSRRIKVCVVDDDVEAATVLAEGLKNHHYEVIQVHSGAEALDVCEHGDIGLLLLDVSMPDMDGFEVCERLMESPKTNDIIVIFVSVKGAAEDVSRGYRLGAVDYITKPYNLPMVMVHVESALRNRIVKDASASNDYSFMDAAYTDRLTGLRNRRYLMERLQEEADKAHRYDFPVSCVVIDVDHIEALDTEVGPVSVDDLLAEVAMSVRSYSRTYDVLARYDGTMFAALLPHTPLDDAIGYGKKIMDEVSATTFSDPNFPTKARLSVGVVTCQNGDACGADRIMGEAMRSLLKAKSHPTDRISGRELKGPVEN